MIRYIGPQDEGGLRTGSVGVVIESQGPTVIIQFKSLKVAVKQNDARFQKIVVEDDAS